MKQLVLLIILHFSVLQAGIAEGAYCFEYLGHYSEEQKQKILKLHNSIFQQLKVYKDYHSSFDLESRKNLNDLVIKDVHDFLLEIDVKTELVKEDDFDILRLSLAGSSKNSGAQWIKRIMSDQRVRSIDIRLDDLVSIRSEGTYNRMSHNVSLQPHVIMQVALGIHPSAALHELRHAMFRQKRVKSSFNIFNRLVFVSKEGLELDNRYYKKNLSVEELYNFLGDISNDVKLFLKTSNSLYEKEFFSTLKILKSIIVSMKKLSKDTDHVLQDLQANKIRAIGSSLFFKASRNDIEFYAPGLVEDVRDFKVRSELEERGLEKIRIILTEHNDRILKLLEYIEVELEGIRKHTKTINNDGQEYKIVEPLELFKLTSKIKRNAYKVGVLDVAFKDLKR